ncbi:MAG TPA: DUF5906 domain-containing protein [Magnetospirillum sp.]|nr:DUF5906 domain-containing protein [Magnetospirillum sp.]
MSDLQNDETRAGENGAGHRKSHGRDDAEYTACNDHDQGPECCSSELRHYLEMVNSVGAEYSGGKGVMLVSAFGQDPHTGSDMAPKIRHFQPGDVAGMVAFLERERDTAHLNFYTPLVVFKPTISSGSKGTLDDIELVFGLVADFDDADAGQWAERLPLLPDFVLESSPGRFQCGFIFDRPLVKYEAQDLAARLVAHAQCDRCTKDVVHVWRLPGLPNRPNKKKFDSGRTKAEMARLVQPWNGSRTPVAMLGDSLPPLPETAPGFDPRKVQDDVRDGFDAAKALRGFRGRHHELLTAVGVLRKRSEQFFAQVGCIIERGYSDAETALILAENRKGAWLKYEDRLVLEVARARHKLGIEEAERAAGIEELEAQFVYVASCKRFVDPDNPGLMFDKEGFSDLYAHQVQDAARTLLARPSFDKARDFGFLPGQARIHDGVLNLWRPSELKPVEGDVSLFQRHMELLIPDEGERNHVLDWAAFEVKHPGTKIRHGILIQGAQRTGKTTLGKILARCIGRRNTVNVANSVLSGKFNGWIVGKSLAVVEELMQSGRLELYNRLKTPITERYIQIEDKNVKAFESDNYANFICFTNHRDCIVVERDDGRFFVVFSPMERQPDEYYAKLYTWLDDGGGYAAVYHWLLHRDVGHFNPNASAPTTAAKRELIKETRTPAEKWVVEALEDCRDPFHRPLFALGDLKLEMGAQWPGEGRIGDILKSLGCVSLGQVRAADGQPQKARLWARPKHDDVPGSERDWAQAGEGEKRKAWKGR